MNPPADRRRRTSPVFDAIQGELASFERRIRDVAASGLSGLVHVRLIRVGAESLDLTEWMDPCNPHDTVRDVRAITRRHPVLAIAWAYPTGWTEVVDGVEIFVELPDCLEASRTSERTGDELGPFTPWVLSHLGAEDWVCLPTNYVAWTETYAEDDSCVVTPVTQQDLETARLAGAKAPGPRAGENTIEIVSDGRIPSIGRPSE